MVRRCQTNMKRKLDRRTASLISAVLAAAAVAGIVETANAQAGRDYYGREIPSRDYRGDQDRDYRRHTPEYRRDAQSPNYRRDTQSRATGKPVMAIISLNDQRISIYDANGRILQAPVSTGSVGYETPAGIFSIVQKKEMHASNLYEDGQMPFMQRITWTGIALHAGVLPGHPASHGCIRLPMSFAQQLFDLTDMGMRVLLVRDDMAPSDIAHPALFKSAPVRKEHLALAALRSDRPSARNAAPSAMREAPVSDADIQPGSARHLQILQSIASSKAAELEAATSREREARSAAAKRATEAASATRSVQAIEANLTKAEFALKDIERRLETATSAAATAPAATAPATTAPGATSPQVAQAEAAKAKAVTRVGELHVQLETAKQQAQARQDAADRANEEAKTATAAKETAARSADEAANKTQPVSVFVSRKTQRLYVRKANYPIYEGPVTIRDPQMPIGTFVFTVLNHLGTSGEMRWSVVAMYPNPTNVEPPPPEPPRRVSARYPDGVQPQPPRRVTARNAEAAPTNVAAAKAAFDRNRLFAGSAGCHLGRSIGGLVTHHLG